MKFNNLKEETKIALKQWCAMPTSTNAFENVVYCLIKYEKKLGDVSWKEIIQDYRDICEKEATKDSSKKCLFNGVINDDYIMKSFEKYEIMREFYKYLRDVKHVIID